MATSQKLKAKALFQGCILNLRHQSDLGKGFGWKLGRPQLSLDSASEQSLILLSAVSPRLSFANELFIHLYHNVISQI